MAKNVRTPSNRLKELREGGVRLTLEEVGQLMGLDLTTVSKHESNTRGLSPEQIRLYAKLYKVEPWELFTEPFTAANEEARRTDQG